MLSSRAIAASRITHSCNSPKVAMAARQLPLTCSGHTRPVVDLAFSEITPQGYFLISACKDGKPMLRHGETGDWIGTFEGHKGAVWSATLSRNAGLAATAAADFSAKLWDAVSGAELATYSHKHIVKSVAIDGDNKRLLTGSNEKKVKVFDMERTDAEPTVIDSLIGNPKRCLWCLDNQTVICGDDKKCLRSWDVRSLTETNSIEVESAVTNMEMSKDGDILVVTHGQTVAFYEPLSFNLIKSYVIPSPVNAASLHPNKLCFVAGGEDFKVYKFDFETGEELESYKGHFGPMHCVQFSPDGELYASGSEDGTLRLWQTTVGKTYGLWKSLEDDERPRIENGIREQEQEQAVNAT